MTKTLPLSEVILGRTQREKLQQGWSPQCLATPAPTGSWGVLKTTAIQAGSFLDHENKELPSHLDARPGLEVRAGDLLLTCAGPRARCGVPTLVRATRPQLILSGKMYRFRVDPDQLDPRFLEMYLLSPDAQRRIEPMKTGISDSGLNLTKDRFLALPVPVPPLEEQRRIVDILEDHLSRLDAATGSLHGASSRTTALRAATAAAVVDTAGRDPATQVRSLANLAHIGTGATPRRGHIPFWSGGSIPWVTSGELAQGLIGQTLQHVTETALAETPVKLWPIGTLLVAMYGEGKTRGTVGELAISSTTNQACAAIVLNDNDATSRAWLRLVLESRYDVMRRSASGGVQPNLNLGYFRGISVPWPAMDIMREAIDVHREVTARAAELRTAIDRGRRRSDNLRRSLLQAAFAGRLTGRSSDLDRAEEMASA